MGTPTLYVPSGKVWYGCLWWVVSKPQPWRKSRSTHIYHYQLPLVILVIYCSFLKSSESAASTVHPFRDWTSCMDRCPEGYVPGLPCYCNEGCLQYENCCDDYYAVCRPEYLGNDTWMIYGSHSYRYFDDPRASSRDASRKCEEEGGMLVSVNTRREHQFLISRVLKDRTLTVYIGAYSQQTESEWKWRDGTKVPLPTDTWNEWYPGEPNNDGVTDSCLLLTNYKFWAIRKVSFDSYFWVDFGCDSNGQKVQGFICEKSSSCEPNPCENGGKCLYIGGNLETECQCREGFVGDKCQGIVGEPWTMCGERQLFGPAGRIQSPGYPRHYPALTHCNWTINVARGNSITLRVMALEMEASKSCIFDRLLIYDGPSTDDALLLGPVCNHSELALDEPIKASASSLLVAFETDDTVQYSGFSLEYSENECGRGTGESGCGTARRLVGDCGEIEVRGGPQQGIGECRWSITSPEGTYINLTFTEFFIEDKDAHCSGGGLSLYDGAVEGVDKIDTYCGWRFPWSVLSSTNHLTLVLRGVAWSEQLHALKLQYKANDPTMHKVINPVAIAEGRSGQFSSMTSSVYAETSASVEQRWRVLVPYGDIISLQWNVMCKRKCRVQIFDGCCLQSRLLVDLDVDPSLSGETREAEAVTSSFQALVRVVSDKGDEDFLFSVIFKSKDLEPEFSGCYRPFFRSAINEPTTENSLITPEKPIVVMAARESHQLTDPGYNSGLYCSWIVQTKDPHRLSFQPTGIDLPRHGSNCDADGIVIYDATAGKTYGPFCGASSELRDISMKSMAEKLKIVFYSDSMGGRRVNGTFRAIVKTSELSQCRFDEMSVPETVYLDASCGVMLSPRLPGDVMPGLWTWIFSPPSDHYFIVALTYVRGPGLLGDCDTFFRLIEIARLSTVRRHWEADLLKVCQNEQLYMSGDPILVPLNQKLGMELSTVAASYPQKWEFKLSYKTLPLRLRPDISDSSPGCPPDHLYFRNHCYRYYYWYYRQMDPKEFGFLETWQAASEQCQSEGSSLLSLYDEDEAAFIKYALSRNNTYWFWDENGTWQTNHRLIFIGLHNRYGHYVWDSGSRMAYADWYKPPSKEGQPALHADTKDGHLLHLSRSQPSSDQGSLCVVMMATSPHGSLNWAKIPCDYPISKAGAICKRKATQGMEAKEVSPPSIDPTLNELFEACPEGWLMVDNRCLRMYTNYDRVKAVNEKTTERVEDMSVEEAQLKCKQLRGLLASIKGPSVPNSLKSLLHLWRHNDLTGHIIVQGEAENVCKIIEITIDSTFQVLKRDAEVPMIDYQLTAYLCSSDKNLGLYSVLCETSPIEKVENCTGDNRHTCADGSCIDIRFKCDGENDCLDASDEIDCKADLDMFTCDNGKMVSISLYCDFVNNCGDNSDEKYCVLEECGPESFHCNSGECIPEGRSCDFHADCRDASDELPMMCQSMCRGFRCFSGRCVPNDLLQDLVSDCPGLTQEDEVLYERGLETLESNTGQQVENKLINMTVSVGCDNGGEGAQCSFNHERCFPRAQTCIYDRKMIPLYGEEVAKACRDGSHLRNDCGSISCPMMFHCPGSYCIPYSRVCDGVIDCPMADDEPDSCQTFNCPGMLRCKGSTHCLVASDICNGEVQCPVYQEDEEYCSEKDILCANACQCSGGILRCDSAGLTNLSTPSFQQTRHLRAIFLSNNNIQVLKETFNSLHWLAVLDLSNNMIESIPDYAFKDLANLRELSINDNLLTLLNPEVFYGLVSLKKLDLSNNKLTFLGRETFLYMLNVQSLTLKGNILTVVPQDTFTDLEKLVEIHTDAYKFCCIAKQVEICTPEPDEFSNCEDLMANYALQVSIWVLGTFAFVGNLFVVIWRVLTERSRVSSMFIINLGVADFLMGVYMLIIASVDVFYRGQYIVYADRWRASGLCQFVGILSMLSCEASVFMLCAITGDRMFTILFPLKAPNFRMKHAKIIVGSLWVISVFLSVLPALGIPYFGDAYFGRTGVCLPFHLSKERLPGWEYSVFIFLVVNLLAFIFIFIGYVMIFQTVRESAKSFGDRSTATTDEYSLAKKLSIIVASDFACWVPIILIGFVALGGTDIPPQVAAWIAVFVLPLNSAINPVLYTMSNIQCSRKRRPGRAPTSNTMSTGISNVVRSMANAHTNHAPMQELKSKEKTAL